MQCPLAELAQRVSDQSILLLCAQRTKDRGFAFMQSGTSPATADISGQAALVRQFFAEGWYPGGEAGWALGRDARDACRWASRCTHAPRDLAGVKGSGPSYPNPSAPLLKAVLISGAIGLTGINFVETIVAGRPVRFGTQVPDPFQGFGRVNLARSLAVQGVGPDGWKLQVRHVGAPQGEQLHELGVCHLRLPTPGSARTACARALG